MLVKFGDLPMESIFWEREWHLDLEGEVHLWGIMIAEEQLREKEMKVALPVEELNEAQKMRFWEDYLRKLSSRWWRRYLSSAYLKAPFDEVKFEQEKGGKIKVRGEFELNFNISHAGEWLFLVFTKEKGCGVDIEHLGKKVEVEKLADSVFHPIEKKWWKSHASKENAFYQLWTRKEALLKSAGIGLDADLRMINCLKGKRIISLLQEKKEMPYENLNFYPDRQHVGCVQFKEGLKIRFFRGNVFNTY
jgi:4'-phosphopantetheinyl transferase